ncbi:MAG: hypothetical protein PHU44_02210 [Syntrophales bacterium]|nr:hypothetical protein [Syntrophales bacterium]MDD5640738.1 hypothetical protein [Syntrophales bacterium]
MGLWMKCPKCQTPNPLFLKTCANCGHSLENLPSKERVYVLESASAAATAPSRLLKATPTPESPLPAKTHETQTAPAKAPPKAKAPRKPRKKKS